MAPLIAVIFSDDSPPEKLTLSHAFNLRNVLYYSPATRYFVHFEDIICIPYTAESCLLKSTNQKKEKSISDLLVMARPERVAFSLSLASSSSELMNVRITSSPPDSIRPCHKAVILPRGTEKALFYHAKPHPHGFHYEA